VDYGTLGESSMANGIQLGLGTRGVICERNFVRQSAERADNFGNGILCQGVGDNSIRNNIVYNTMENAIFVNERTVYINEAGELCPPVSPVPDDEEETATCLGFQFIDLSPTTKGVSLVHNTLMYPAQSRKLGRDQNGVRILYNALFLPPTEVLVKNNLIFGLPSGDAIRISNDLTKLCLDNVIISEGWKKVSEQYLRSFGPYEVEDASVPYLSAMQSYFTRPEINEEDNVFRSPVDFYPIHSSIINSAADDCPEAGVAGVDFFETARSEPDGCANDYGAVELEAPVFTITEDCGEGEFTIQADGVGTFTWTFNEDETGTQTGPTATFDNPDGLGSYLLEYNYISTDDNCTDVSGMLYIELNCSCPCTGNEATDINVNASREGTSWQDTELMEYVDFQNPNGNTLDLTNHCLSINGRLLIDDYEGNGRDIDLYLKNGFIRMQPGAEIVVQNDGGLRIEDIATQENNDPSEAGIYGCGFMWEGIDVEEGGRIIIKNSTIQDAITAIGITGLAEIEIQNNNFENNYRGINIVPAFDPTGNDPTIFSLSVSSDGVSNNFFVTNEGGLKGTFDAAHIPAGTRGDVGIKTAYLNIGLPMGTIYPGNTFVNLRHGIYAKDGRVFVGESTFEQVDYGARLYNTLAVFLDNSFDDVALRGIESLDAAWLVALDNNMERMHQRGINYEGSGNLTNYSILRNTIAAKDHCINIEASTATVRVNVSDNNLTLLELESDEEFLGRAALRVFNTGAPIVTSNEDDELEINPLSLPTGIIENNTSTTVNGYGEGIVLENMSSLEIKDNEVVYQNPNDEAMYSHGIRLDDSAENYLEGNTVQVADIPDGTPTVRNIYLSGSPYNELSCNSTNGGEIGVGFYGACNDTELKTTIFGSHTVGVDCGDGTIIGIQSHRGNTWLPAGEYDNAAEHRGILDEIDQSRFQVKEFLGSDEWEERFWPTSISTPEAMDAQWFRPSEISSVACEEGGDPGPGPSPSPVYQLVAEDNYVTGKYATVHKWEAEKQLFARLDKDESLLNSETWFRDFYDRVDNEAVGDYVKVQEQFKVLLGLSSTERQQAEELQISIQEKLQLLMQIEESYSQATTEADSTALEADWLEQSSTVSEYFTEWQQLAADVRQRITANIATLQANNAALPEDIVPAANEKRMNTIQLKRIGGEPITQEERHQVAILAFSCPLEAGNAVYRARSVLRTWGNYVFDDTANCKARKEDDDKGDGDGSKNKDPDNELITPNSQWRVYPNPAQHQLWIAGNRMEELESIQLFNGFGQSVLHQQNKVDVRMEIQLPSELKAGIYFLRLQLHGGEIHTQKILLQS
jgi:hypothetical protein